MEKFVVDLLTALMPVVIIPILITWVFRGVEAFREHIMDVQPLKSKHIPRSMRIKFRVLSLVVSLFNMSHHKEELFFRWRSFCNEAKDERLLAMYRELDEGKQKEFMDWIDRRASRKWRPYRKERAE